MELAELVQLVNRVNDQKMRLLYQFPTWLQRLYGGVTWRKNPSSKVVYLTFDDGPVPECTPYVLDILASYGVKATFFMVGENAERNPELVARVRQEGHTVGNHTYSHKKGYKTCTSKYINDVQKATEVLGSQLFRPPHGRMKYSQKKALLSAGYTIYLWDVLTHDYNARYTAERILSIVKRYVRNGSVITMHDSQKSTRQTLAALPMIIQYLQEAGYEMKSL